LFSCSSFILRLLEVGAPSYLAQPTFPAALSFFLFASFSFFLWAFRSEVAPKEKKRKKKAKYKKKKGYHILY
jgi:hypothetical protein